MEEDGMNQNIRALKFILKDFLEEHQTIKRIIEEMNSFYRSFVFSRLFKKLNLDEFEKRLKKRLQLKEQKQ